MALPRVLLVDDHLVILDALANLLKSECDVVGQINDGNVVVDAARRLRPDVVVLDIAMPPFSGVALGRQLKHLLPDVRLVFLTANDDPDVAAEAYSAGADAYVLKRAAAEELRLAIRQVAQDRLAASPRRAEEVAASTPAARSKASDGLTGRQRDVLRLLASGHSMKEVAADLNISVRTVAFHKYRTMTQLRIRSTAALIRYAVAHGIVTEAPDVDVVVARTASDDQRHEED